MFLPFFLFGFITYYVAVRACCYKNRLFTSESVHVGYYVRLAANRPEIFMENLCIVPQ